MAPHPYLPESLSLPGYQEQVVQFPVIFAAFFGTCAVFGALAWLCASHLSTQERAMAVWMLLTAGIHIITEGAFAVYDKFYQNTDPNMLLLELWKEYSKADSRYAARDPAVVAIETCTAFIAGPACLVAFVALLYRWSWRWSLIIVASMMQLYGDVLYFATNWLEGGVANRPEPLYFWFYFVVMNGIWIVLPAWCILYASFRCTQAVHVLDKVRGSKHD